jgi:hypothetical protein
MTRLLIANMATGQGNTVAVMSDATPGSPNSKSGAIAQILTSANTDNVVKLGTLALVIVSGGGNLFATKEAERSTDHEIRKAIQEIHEIHAVFDSSIERQKRLEKMLKELKDKNGS